MRPLSGQLTEILDAVGRAIDSLGGSCTMQYATLGITTALRTGAKASTDN